MLLITAFIWGVAFVAQREGSNFIKPFSFTGIRFILGGLVLLPVIKIMDRLGISERPETEKDRKNLLIGGMLCGSALGIASVFQQFGITMGTPAGKAGFITACYIVLVPIFGIFLKKKCPKIVAFAVMLTVIGLYLLCMNGELTVQLSDAIVLVCAAFFAVQILLIDYYVQIVDGVRLSCVQFFTCGIMNSILMIIFDIRLNGSGLPEFIAGFREPNAWIALLYAAFLSSGVAYTLQILGQRDFDPTIASLLMSLESVFSVLAGWVILGERLGFKELLGCVLIFTAVCLAQLPEKA